MRRAPILATLTLVLSPLPALASSGAEQVGTIARRLDSAGAVAGLRGRPYRSPCVVRGVRTGAPSELDMISTADHVASTWTLVVRAMGEDRRGDKRARKTTMSEAEGVTGVLP